MVAAEPREPSHAETNPEAPPGGAPPAAEQSPTPARSWLRSGLVGVTLVLAAILLFTGLGQPVFWDDEAATALGAEAIMRTGGNTALTGNGNVVAYQDGNALIGFDNRLEPLLPAYATAASFEVFGVDTWAGRLPFALFGLGTFALLMLWVRRESWQAIVVLAMASLGNVSLILYSRNCRYYAPAIFFSVALAYLYRQGQPTVGRALGFAALSILLFTSNYLNYVAFYVCLGLDYLVWQRKRSPWDWRLLGCAFLPQIVVNGIIGSIWNPLRTPHADNLVLNTFQERMKLLFWQWRDMNACEQMCLPLLFVTLAVGLLQRRTLLVRGCVALAVYVVTINAISPQIVANGSVADVRYLTPLIPLAVGLEAATLCVLLGKRPLPLFAAALLIFGTNFVNGWLGTGVRMRSTLVSYLQELADPPRRAYEATIQWVNENVPAGSSVLVRPDFGMYPLMFHAPQAVYAWQFHWPPRAAYAGLPAIHFEGRVAPDYIIGFGPYLAEAFADIRKMNRPDLEYEQVATLNVYWRNVARPELFMHRFEAVRAFNPNRSGVYVFKRVNAPSADHPQGD